MFSVVIIPYPFIVTFVSRWQHYLSKNVQKPKAINLARWKDGKICELHRLPPVGKGSGKCHTARLVLEAGSARLGMRFDVKVRTVSESVLVRLLSKSLLVARQWLRVAYFHLSVQLTSNLRRNHARKAGTGPSPRARAGERSTVLASLEEGKRARVRSSPDKKIPRSKQQQQHIPDGNVALKLRVLDGQHGVCASGQVYNPKWAMFLSMIDRTIAAGTDALLAPGQPGETAFCA